MLRIFFKTLNVVALITLLLSCLGTYIEPVPFWQLSFIAFAFPVVLLVNFLFLLIWIYKRDVFGLITLIAIVLTWKFINSTFAFNFSVQNNESGIKLMTWNVKNFDLYNWSKNKATRNIMMGIIKKENPDILCLQEFYSNNQRFKNIAYLRDSLGYKYCYFPPSVKLSKPPNSKIQRVLWRTGVLTQEWGVATFSKFPIVDSGQIEFERRSTNSCIYTDITIEEKTVRVYNVHFESIRLVEHDYTMLDSIEQQQQFNRKALYDVVQKMAYAYDKRAEQAKTVAEYISEYDGTEILCGDFNDVPVSFTYNTVKGDLKDAFVEKGKGFGTTYAHKLSFFRIDYTLFDPTIKINSYKRMRKELSDHYPVVTTFSF